MDWGTLHVNAALLADRHLSALELRWALKERDIARPYARLVMWLSTTLG